jgi:hypothetical protein
VARRRTFRRATLSSKAFVQVAADSRIVPLALVVTDPSSVAVPILVTGATGPPRSRRQRRPSPLARRATAAALNIISVWVLGLCGLDPPEDPPSTIGAGPAPERAHLRSYRCLTNGPSSLAASLNGPAESTSCCATKIAPVACHTTQTGAFVRAPQLRPRNTLSPRHFGIRGQPRVCISVGAGRPPCSPSSKGPLSVQSCRHRQPR